MLERNRRPLNSDDEDDSGVEEEDDEQGEEAHSEEEDEDEESEDTDDSEEEDGEEDDIGSSTSGSDDDEVRRPVAPPSGVARELSGTRLPSHQLTVGQTRIRRPVNSDDDDDAESSDSDGSSSEDDSEESEDSQAAPLPHMSRALSPVPSTTTPLRPTSTLNSSLRKSSSSSPTRTLGSQKKSVNFLQSSQLFHFDSRVTTQPLNPLPLDESSSPLQQQQQASEESKTTSATMSLPSKGLTTDELLLVFDEAHDTANDDEVRLEAGIGLDYDSLQRKGSRSGDVSSASSSRAYSTSISSVSENETQSVPASPHVERVPARKSTDAAQGTGTGTGTGSGKEPPRSPDGKSNTTEEEEDDDDDDDDHSSGRVDCGRGAETSARWLSSFCGLPLDINESSSVSRRKDSIALQRLAIQGAEEESEDALAEEREIHPLDSITLEFITEEERKRARVVYDRVTTTFAGVHQLSSHQHQPAAAGLGSYMENGGGGGLHRSAMIAHRDHRAKTQVALQTAAWMRDDFDPHDPDIMTFDKFQMAIAFLGFRESLETLRSIFDLAKDELINFTTFLKMLAKLLGKEDQRELEAKIEEMFDALYEGTCADDSQRDDVGRRFLLANVLRRLITTMGGEDNVLSVEEADQLIRETHPIRVMTAAGPVDRIFLEQYRSMLLQQNP